MDKKKSEAENDVENRRVSTLSNVSLSKPVDLQDELKDAEERGNWTGKLDFILSCIGYAVGLGNVWRFPYLCFKNGGGAFLFPYIIMLFLCGLPIFFMELAVGQFSSQGPITLYKKLNHYFVGIGWGMCVISFLTSVYYNVIIMWSIFYLFASFAPEVPWKHCDPTWASPWCKELSRIEDLETDAAKLNETVKRFNTTCLGMKSESLSSITIGNYKAITDLLDEQDYPSAMKNVTFGDLSLENLPEIPSIIGKINATTPNFPGLGNVLPTILRAPLDSEKTKIFKECQLRFEVPSGDYFHRYMLEIQNSDGADGLGTIRWQLLLVFIIAWIVIFLCLSKGVRSSGKVVYVTATFPYLVLIALLIRGVTLPGYYKGIEFYIIPQWDKLTDAKVWSDAATQIFYSLGPGFGGLLTFASYNKFNNNCHRDAVIVALINCGTSIFAGFAVFSIIGFMSYSTGLEVSEVPVSGEGLLFIAYPEAISRMPAPPVWAILFFFMVFTLGLDSQFAMLETVISAIADNFHEVLRTKKTLLTFSTCFVCFLCGLPCVTYGGFYVVQLMNWYCASYSLLIVSFFNLVVINHIYGIRNFAKDIEMMLGVKPLKYYWVMWFVVTPIVILLIIIASAVQDTPAYYRTYEFPPSIRGVGWATMVASIGMIPFFFFFEMCRYKKTRKAIAKEMKPAPTWGPALEENRVGRYEIISNETNNLAPPTEKTGFDNTAMDNISVDASSFEKDSVKDGNAEVSTYM